MYHPRPFDLVSTLKSDICTIKSMAEEKGVMLEVQMPASALITGDDNMLATVVRNLLVNAVKFTAAEGTVVFEIKDFGDKGIKGGSGYIVSVTDTGIGMTFEQIENLFSLNRQQSRPGTIGESGTGLGLIVCKEMIEKHGSKLIVESEEGKGSRFWFEVSGTEKMG